MGAPYYGAYFVAAALANADSVAMLDTGKTPFAVYAIYKGDKPFRLVLYNSDHYTGGAKVRSNHTFHASGMGGLKSVRAKRLTAPAATTRQDRGENPTFGGQVFGNGTCRIGGKEVVETIKVEGRERRS